MLKKTHLLSDAAKGINAKPEPVCEGPYTITDVIAPYAYKLNSAIKSLALHLKSLALYLKYLALQLKVQLDIYLNFHLNGLNVETAVATTFHCPGLGSKPSPEVSRLILGCH